MDFKRRGNWGTGGLNDESRMGAVSLHISQSPRLPVQPFEDVALANLLRGRAWEVAFGPDVPAAHVLMSRERLVGALDGGRGVCLRVAHDEDGEGFGAARALDADHGALLDFGLAVERCLDVFGVNVEAGGGDDCLFLAALEVDLAVLVHLSDVARAQPAFVVERLRRAVVPVARRDVRAAH